MAEKLVMLALSPTMETGTIAQWLKREGDIIASGDILCEVETDKATMEYENALDGTLLRIVAPAGSRVAVGQPICIVGEPGENIGDFEQQLRQQAVSVPAPGQVPGDGSPTPLVAEVAPSSGVLEQTAHETPSPGTGTVAASPLARRLAQEKGIKLATIHGSGPGGRIVKKDLGQLLQGSSAVSAKTSATTAGSDRVIPVTEKRSVIAQRLAGSLFTAPHYFMRNPVSVDTLLAFRADCNSSRKEKLSLNAFLIKCAAETLRRHPQVNASWHDTGIIEHASIDIALAVAQKDGLITPVVRDCVSKGIGQIDIELKALINLARENKLTPEQYTGSTFTISNLGSSGIRDFTAIINPPEAAILAVGEAYRQPVADEQDRIHVEKTMNMTLSVDHRILDGAVAANFFADLKRIIENPVRALV